MPLKACGGGFSHVKAYGFLFEILPFSYLILKWGIFE